MKSPTAADTTFAKYLALSPEDKDAFKLMLKGREGFEEPAQQMPLAEAQPPKKQRQPRTPKSNAGPAAETPPQAPLSMTA